MSNDNLSANKPGNPAHEGGTKSGSGAGSGRPEGPAAALPPLFRRVDWLTFALTFLTAFIGYQLTLAPDVTLQDSGELAVGSFYAGVPHPPGYPVWTIYTWLATVLFPVSNIAYRVAAACSLTSALGCGLLGLLVSRGSSMIVEGMPGLKGLARRLENGICVASGFVAGCLLAFNGFYWSQSVIVEVYCFGVFSFMVVLCCLMRWMYAPHQYRYLYLASLVFGICFTNHQTLLIATMGIEVLILTVQRRLGRDIFWFNSLVYLAALLAKSAGYIGAFDTNAPLFVIFNAIGIWSICTALWNSLTVGWLTKVKVIGAHLIGNVLIFALWLGKGPNSAFTDNMHTLVTLVYNAVGPLLIYGYYWLCGKGERPFTEWKPLAVVVAAWCVGAGFYFYMPLTSMTNPPMNWGYPRTYEGFVHALSRGQYERANPTNDLGKFISQLHMYAAGAVEEFNAVYLLVALVPFFFFGRMQKRERSWLIGLTAIWAFQGILLLIMLNPGTDKQSRDLNKVFFNTSFAMISIGVGYGLTLLLSHLAVQYERYRAGVLGGLAVAAAVALYSLANTMWETSYPLIVYAHVFGIGLAVAAFVALLASRARAPMGPLLGLVFLMPAYSVMTHWTENEQHNHLFGFWFGHDMFTPPDFGRKGELYPEMARDTVLFGGTDPGRFCPTYMIFCESFIPPHKRRDPNFDRRDVYLITQNALADGTYLSYIRAHYNRSTQIDPPFFQELFRSKKEIEAGVGTNLVARMVGPLDRFFTALGKRVEERRRREGVYPPKEIHTPSMEESKKCFEDYITDAQRRLAAGQLKPGEDVRVVDSRVQVSGQVSVMQINGLLTKVIFDANPDHEFYVEESFPLDWMYPHLTPSGIIMKITRQPVKEFTDEIVKKDHLFWSLYSERLVGNWITYDTSVTNLCEFAERTYQRMDFRGFKGQREFVRDNDAQKAFSKLRSAIAGLYVERMKYAAPGSAELERLTREAEFAYKQAFAFCPYSPEAVFRFAQLLLNEGRAAEAYLVARTCQKFDPENPHVADLVRQLAPYQPGGAPPVEPQAPPPQAQSQLQQLEQLLNSNPGNAGLAEQLAAGYLQARQTDRAYAVLDRSLAYLTGQYKTNPGNHELVFSIAALLTRRQRGQEATQMLVSLAQQLETEVKTNPTNASSGLLLAQTYMHLQKNDAATKQLDVVLNLPIADAESFVRMAQTYAQLGNAPQLEKTLLRLVKLVPDRPEAWFDLAALQAIQGENAEALLSLSNSLTLNRKRGKSDPAAKDLSAVAAQDPRFGALRKNPEFKKLLDKK